MPIFNTKELSLREAVNSILGQTFIDFEFLIVNDSPDNKKLDKIIKNYKDERIKYQKNKNNLGLEASTNKLLKIAKGEYVAIFDHDDISLPDRLEKEVEFLDKHLDVGLVSGQFRVFGNQDIISENPLEDKDIRTTLLTASCVSHTSMMFRKKVATENNIKYEKAYFPASSYRIITRFALVTKLHNLPDMVLRYRMDGNNTSIRHANLRIEARERIRKEYGENLTKDALIKRGLDIQKVELISKQPFRDETRHYKAYGKAKDYFVKTSLSSFDNEFKMAKLMHESDSRYFVKPVDYFNDNFNYFLTEWLEAPTLEGYVKNSDLDKSDRLRFVNDLISIYKILKDKDVVHRDLTFKNFLVYKGELRLIDFHFGVFFDDYKEVNSVVDNIIYVAEMGNPYNAGLYKWDDAYSFSEISKTIMGDDNINIKKLKLIKDDIGKRVIIPDKELLLEVINIQKTEIDRLRQISHEVGLRHLVKQRLKNTKAFRLFGKLRII